MPPPPFLGWIVIALAAVHVASVLTVASELWTGRTLLVRRNFSVAGLVAWGSLLALTAATALLAFWNLAGLRAGGVTLTLLWIVALLGLARGLPGLVQLYEGWEIALRRRWRMPTRPLTEWTPGPDAPFITVQVPIHAEPPAVVIATLEALSGLDYPAYEVLVIDNNTFDEQLWRPVEQRCAELGFRFLHVMGIEGAKAGALNWARPKVDPRTELVALIDADYQVAPGWLRDIAGHFDDPTLGFVQCPHAHRELDQSLYRRMADAEHAWPQWSEMIARSEHGAGTTAGTMAMIRLATLDAAGGWAAWCLTEDSEFAIRAHAVGYRSIYVDQIYGWGLVPETFEALKVQRYRWTYGPGQEFKRHVLLYLPGPWRRPSKLTGAQRWRHGNYGLAIMNAGVGALVLPLTIAVLVSMAVARQVPQVTPALLVALAASVTGRRVMRWTIYRKSVGLDTVTTLGGLYTSMALRPTVSGAALDVLLGRPASWRRTDKFRPDPSALRALVSTRKEIALTVSCLAALVVAALTLPLSPGAVVLMLTFGWQAFQYSAAPVIALIAERDLRRTEAAGELPGLLLGRT